MALTRRATQRVSASIWPGFVDAMSALVMVLMFVLTIFMVVQFVLRDTISGQATKLDELSKQVAELADALGLERKRSDGLKTRVSDLTSSLAQTTGIVDQQELQIRQLTATRDAQAARIADLNAENSRLADRESDLIQALAQARDEVDAQAEQARLAAARRAALEALIADLRTDIEARDASVSDLQARLDTAREKLSQEEAARLAEAAAAQALRDKLAASEDDLDALTLALEQERKRAEDTLTLLAAARAASEDLNARLAAALVANQDQAARLSSTEETLAAARAEADKLRDQLGDEEELRAQLAAALAAKLAAEQDAQQSLSEAERQASLLAAARGELDQQERISTEAQRRLALLNQQVADLRAQVGQLQTLLDASDERDAQAQVQIEALGARLNVALARVAAEERRRAELEEAERKRLEDEARQLERYRSEFFGKLRDLLAGREGVRIDGDRFVFSSEVLFPVGSAELSDKGKEQIARVAEILQDVADEIPPELDWVLRVDGHTDDRQIHGGGEYADNWELSQARALSVVRYMIDELDFEPKRLVAAGFGEFRPIAEGDSDEARAQNRRIELKLTER
ncbi:MAG TPA: peptidoglycan -binding protein [Aliiroseovarius sp.]|nr:peptidoglycan -binding protein [Aliiroseovarius sp.]